MAETHGFSRRRRGGVRLALDVGEVSVLDHLLEQLVELLEPEGTDAHEQLDPLAAMVGIGTATQVPDDPALARLLPDAYGEDPEASAEFRRYTELSLRESKRAQAELARATLADPDRDVLSDAEADAWLRALNDLRLALGTRLDVTEDLEAERAALEALPEGDPRIVMYDIYDWLGYLQATLLQALDV
jgi:Domain of unknown function (DUF2017)